MLRTLKHDVVNKIDLNDLLRYFKHTELAFVFGVTEDYIYKTDRLQRIIIANGLEQDEMKYGDRGSWMESEERKCIKSILNKSH